MLEVLKVLVDAGVRLDPDDDSHVSESSISDLDGRTAYMLFYCRRDISQAGRVI